MTRPTDPIRVLQSFPHKIGAARICTTAWHQAAGVAEAGGDVLVFPGVVHRPLPPNVRTRPTLARGRWRVPYRALGRLRAMKLHDRLVARRLPTVAEEIDVVHVWPQGALETLRTARRFGIPTVLERPNAHTRFAYEVVQRECERLGVMLPPDHEHAYNAAILRERKRNSRSPIASCVPPISWPGRSSTRASRTRDWPGTSTDTTSDYSIPMTAPGAGGLTVLFVGVCAVRKGVHFALEAWLASDASETGKFLIAGEFLPEYEARLAAMLAHPSVQALGHRATSLN